MTLCLAAGAATLALALGSFTLSWTHSVERIEWREHWAVERDGLVLRQAAVKGSGAGMEVPDDAILRDGFWFYEPRLPPQTRVSFADAGRAGSDWTLCDGERCAALRSLLPVEGNGFSMEACERSGIGLSQAIAEAHDRRPLAGERPIEAR